MMLYFHRALNPIQHEGVNIMARLGTTLNDKLWLAGDEDENFAFVMTTEIPPGIPPIVRLHTAGLQLNPAYEAAVYEDESTRSFLLYRDD